MPTRVLVIEDEQRLARSWLRILKSAGYDVKAAHSLEEAKKLDLSGAHVVLLDLMLPDGPGSTLLDDLLRQRPRPAIAVVSGFVDAAWATELFGKCDVVVPKPVTEATLLDLVAKLSSEPAPPPSVADFCEDHGLSPRETQVLTLAVEGLDNPLIASRLGCTTGTVKSYWHRLLTKTRLKSQRALLALLREPSH